jgi:hypothetical protein
MRVYVCVYSHVCVCVCVQLYKIRAGKTVPQGLLLMCMLLMFSMLTLNVFMLSLAPEYMTFGYQRYVCAQSPRQREAEGQWAEVPGRVCCCIDDVWLPTLRTHAHTDTRTGTGTGRAPRRA